MINLFMTLALVCVIWGVVSAIAIGAFLARRGKKVSILFFRFLIYRYIHQYSEITTEENGRPGFWFYSYIIAMNTALVCVIIGLIIR